MIVRAVKTRKVVPPQDDMYAVFEESLPKIEERSVVVVTSKIVAIHQGRCIPLVEGGVERDEVAYKESDWYTPRDSVPGKHILFTRKRNILIASGGIDHSNAKGHMVLWPEKADEMAKEIHGYLKKRFGLREVGVIISDSRVMMMRRGTLGIAISHFGFNPVEDYVGQPDIFGRHLEFQSANVADSLAVAAVLAMGEGDEQTPVAVVTEIPMTEFSEDEAVNKGKPTFSVPLEEDLFHDMLAAVPWKKGNGGLTNKELAKLKRGERLD